MARFLAVNTSNAYSTIRRLLLSPNYFIMPPRADNPKPHQFRNLTFQDHRPKFLADIDAALRGSKPESFNSHKATRDGGHDADDRFQETEVLDPSRPAIPVRPRGHNYDESEDDEPQIVYDQDLSVIGRLSDEDEEEGEDLPEVVVVKQGRDLTKEEFEAEKIRLRDQPNTPSTLPSSSRKSIKPSLAFSSSDKTSRFIGKRKILPVDSDHDSSTKPDGGWSELVKRTKGDRSTIVASTKEEKETAQTQQSSLSKKQKKSELKAKNKKAKSLMSFS